MLDAEALLLIDYQEPEVLEAHRLLQDLMGAEEHVYLPCRQLIPDPGLGALRDIPGEDGCLDRERAQPAPEVVEMLLGEDDGRRQEGDLLARHDSLEGSAEGDLRLAVADIAADEAVHHLIGFHIALDVIEALKLVRGLRIRERGLELDLPVIVRQELEAMDSLALRIELYQLRGKLRGIPYRLLLLLRPALRAEPVQLGRAAVVAYVLLYQVSLLDRDIEVILVRVLYLYVIPLDTRVPHPLDLQEDADAEVHMHDIVAFPEVDEGIERRRNRLRDALRAVLLAPENLTVQHDEEADGLDLEARGDILHEYRGIIIAQHALQPLPLHIGGGDDEDAPAVLQEACDIVLEVLHVAEVRARGGDGEMLVPGVCYIVDEEAAPD